MDAISTLAMIVIIMSTVTAALSYIGWTGSKRSFRVAFVLTMMMEILIGWSYLLDTFSNDMGDKLFWNNFEYIGYLGTPLFFVIFALQFTGNKVSKKILAALSVPAILFEAAVITNEHHHLFYNAIHMPNDDPLRSFQADYGPIFYLLAAYILLLVVIGVTVLVKQYMKSTKANRMNVVLVMFAGMISLFATVVNFTFVEDVPGGVILMIGFVAASIPLFVGAFGFELFEILPFANEMVLDTMKDGTVVIDDRDRLLFMNRSAKAMFDRKPESLIGADIQSVIPTLPEGSLSKDELETPPIMTVGDRTVELYVQSIRDPANIPMGKLLLLRDVTQRRAAEEDARIAHEKLDLFNQITRHDVMNQLIILEARLSLMKAKMTEPDHIKFIESCQKAVHNIDKQLNIAKDYHRLGSGKTTWQSLESVMKGLEPSFDLKKVQISLDTKGTEILADPSLTKVFYNLIDNSLAHGGNVTRISLTTSETKDGLEIVYEDDGQGISQETKMLIFENGVGRHSGLGLFLTKEILKMGGMDIVEDGEPGKGARFRISVPKGSYRYPEDRTA